MSLTLQHLQEDEAGEVTTFIKDDQCNFNVHHHHHYLTAFSVLRHGNISDVNKTKFVRPRPDLQDQDQDHS